MFAKASLNEQNIKREFMWKKNFQILIGHNMP